MYLIVGANGYIGSYVIKNVLELTDKNIVAVDNNLSGTYDSERIKWVECDVSKECDIEQLNYIISSCEPVDVIYLAAYHHPNDVKNNPRKAWHINVTCLSNFINSLNNVRCFFFSSTEMVYPEADINHRFKENDEKKPVNLYGINKMVGESIVTGFGYNVVRFPFLIGPSLLNTKKHFYDEIVDTIITGNRIEMFTDNIKAPLDFDTATKCLVKLIMRYNKDMPKIINISGDKVMSKYEIGLHIANQIGCSEELIVPISMKEDNSIFTEKRAVCSLMDNTLVKSLLQIDKLEMKLGE